MGSPQSKIQVGSYNICNDGKSQQSATTKWSRRMPHVVKAINHLFSIGVAILALQEPRNLDGEIPVAEFLSQLDYLVTSIEARDESKYAFSQVILYNPQLVMPTGKTGVERFGDDSGKTVWMATWVEFRAGSGSTVTVVNVHFPIPIAAKMRACQQLLGMSLPESDITVFTGDFNIFPDDTTDCRAILTGAGLVDIRGERNQDGTSVQSTFIGFEHDDFKAPLSGGQQCLDNFFVRTRSGVTLADDCHKTVWMTPITGVAFETRDYPSDHFPITTTLRWA